MTLFSSGHHKLIRWGVVTHGCIDGKTRLVVFLRASTNNEASTVLKSFLEATDAHGWPSRIRADCGGENMLVKEAIERVRGLNRGELISFLSRTPAVPFSKTNNCSPHCRELHSRPKCSQSADRATLARRLSMENRELQDNL